MDTTSTGKDQRLIAMLYTTIKNLHIFCAAASISGFVLRGIWMWRDSELLNKRLTKRAPHFVDTVLFITGIVLVCWSRQYPFQQAWLTAKLGALIIYIALGMIALHPGRTQLQKRGALIFAVLTFFYIIVTATTRQPDYLLNLLN